MGFFVVWSFWFFLWFFVCLFFKKSSQSTCRAIGFCHFSKYDPHVKDRKWEHIQSLTIASNKVRNNIQKPILTLLPALPNRPCFFLECQEKFFIFKFSKKPQFSVLVPALRAFALPCSVSFTHTHSTMCPCTHIASNLLPFEEPAGDMAGDWAVGDQTWKGCLSGCCRFVPHIHCGGSAEFARPNAKWRTRKVVQILESKMITQMFRRMCLNSVVKRPPKEERMNEP